ncbi:MAG: hypothetical protein COA78_13555 [Blastopirellula sp.]|nr:MAG: hypothetical protein COA78_13555 [Blastopirellula sp.]
MRVCGQDEIQQFIANCDHAAACEDARALLYELTNGDWANLEAFQDDYPLADFNELPKVRFLLADSTILVECITCFDRGILLVVGCQRRDTHRSDNQNRTDREAA